MSLSFSTAPPMSLWNRDALVSLRGDLKLYVSMSTGLSDSLEEAAGGFMSPREAQVVRERLGSSEQMGKLIEILCGKGDKDFRTFHHMLRRTNNGVWADELKRKAKKIKKEKGVCRGEGSHSEIQCSMSAIRGVRLSKNVVS